jgi:hypothetical protein
MGIAELAAVFQTPDATIRTRLHRARKALKEKMAGSAPAAALETLESMDMWAKNLGRAKR